MTYKLVSVYLFSICFFVAVLGLSGCGIHKTEEKSSTEEERLVTRVNQFMQAQIDDEWGIVYDLLDGDFRKAVSKKKFLKESRDVEFGKYSIDKIEIASDHKSANVRIISDFIAKNYKFADKLSTHRWVFEEDNWYNKTTTYKDLFKNPKQ